MQRLVGISFYWGLFNTKTSSKKCKPQSVLSSTETQQNLDTIHSDSPRFSLSPTHWIKLAVNFRYSSDLTNSSKVTLYFLHQACAADWNASIGGQSRPRATTEWPISLCAMPMNKQRRMKFTIWSHNSCEQQSQEQFQSAEAYQCW